MSKMVLITNYKLQGLRENGFNLVPGETSSMFYVFTSLQEKIRVLMGNGYFITKDKILTFTIKFMEKE